MLVTRPDVGVKAGLRFLQPLRARFQLGPCLCLVLARFHLQPLPAGLYCPLDLVIFSAPRLQALHDPGFTTESVTAVGALARGGGHSLNLLGNGSDTPNLSAVNLLQTS